MNEHSFCQHLLSRAWADFRVTHPEMRIREFTYTTFELARGHKCYTIEGPNGFRWESKSCCAWSAKTDALPAYEKHLKRLETKKWEAVQALVPAELVATVPRVQTGWITEVFAEGKWSRNAIVWPDEHSAKQAGADLLSRWMVPTDYRAVQVDEEPNRPTWDEHVADKGLPPQSVQV